jgi:hypothetical protein
VLTGIGGRCCCRHSSLAVGRGSVHESEGCRHWQWVETLYMGLEGCHRWRLALYTSVAVVTGWTDLETKVLYTLLAVNAIHSAGCRCWLGGDRGGEKRRRREEKRGG